MDLHIVFLCKPLAAQSARVLLHVLVDLLDVFVAVADLRERLAAPVRANVRFLLAMRAQVVVELRQAGQHEALATIEVAHVQAVVFGGLLGLLEVVDLIVLALGHVADEVDLCRVEVGSCEDADLPVWADEEVGCEVGDGGSVECFLKVLEDWLWFGHKLFGCL